MLDRARIYDTLLHLDLVYTVTHGIGMLIRYIFLLNLGPFHVSNDKRSKVGCGSAAPATPDSRISHAYCAIRGRESMGRTHTTALLAVGNSLCRWLQFPSTSNRGAAIPQSSESSKVYKAIPREYRIQSRHGDCDV